MTNIINSPVTVVPGSVAVDTSGLFTPGAAFSIDATAQIINAAWDLGNTKYNTFAAKVQAVSDSIQAMINAQTYNISPSNVAAISINEPVVTIPTSADATTVLNTFENEVNTQITVLANRVTTFLSTYFPNDATDYNTAETWLLAALNNTSGLPTAVRDQITNDDFARITADSLRAQDAVIQQFAARRFPMPSGQAASAILQIQQKTQDAMAESSRKITMNSIEQLKWAAEKVVSLRQLAFEETLNYTKTLSAGQSVAAQIVPSAYRVPPDLLSAWSSFYNARTEAQKTIASVNEFNADKNQEAAEKNQMANLTLVEDKVKALMGEVAALAQMTTSLFNNVHAGASTSYGVSA